jgi:hypothetical protein
VVIGVHLKGSSEIIFIVEDPTVGTIFAVPVWSREPCHYIPHFFGESTVWVGKVVLVLAWCRGGSLLLPIASLVNHGRTLDLLELGLEHRESLVESAFGEAGLWRWRLLHVPLILLLPFLDINQLFPGLVQLIEQDIIDEFLPLFLSQVRIRVSQAFKLILGHFHAKDGCPRSSLERVSR